MAKDRNSFASISDSYQLAISVDTDGKMKSELAQDTDSTNYVAHTSDTALSATTWYYLVYSYALQSDAELKTVTFWKDNAADGSGTYTGIFHVDHADYETYIGIERTDTAAYDANWNGYIYDFHIYH
jgi:hypothetical protein